MADDSDDEAEALPLLTPRIGEDVTVASMADGMARFIAVTCVFLGMLLLATLLVLGLYHGAIRMKAHPDAYMGGLHRLESLRDAIIDELMRDLHLDKKVHDGFTTETKLMDSLLDKTREWVWHFVDMTISGLSESLSSAAIMLLYVLFWLLQPLPTGGRAGRLVRKYLYKKTFASFLYGLCVMLLFLLLGIDMAVLFGVVSFFLNFVPEIGSFISILVPIPVILLDGRHQNPLLVLMLAVIGQLVFKFIFSNVLEVKLIEHDSDLRVHPVWVILGLSYFGYIWGPIGMLISVPILAFVKTMATSLRQSSLMENLPPGGKAEWRNLAAQFVICLEGSSSRKKSAFGSRQSSN
jgi:predicted PurR-regulated permease PerM